MISHSEIAERAAREILQDLGKVALVDEQNWMTQRILAAIEEAVREREDLLWQCARELGYVQSVENCTSGLCATSLGKDLVDRAVKLLGVDFYCDTYEQAKIRCARPKELGEKR